MLDSLCRESSRCPFAASSAKKYLVKAVAALDDRREQPETCGFLYFSR